MNTESPSGSPGVGAGLAGIFLGVMALITFVNVLGRYLFHYSLAFTEEVTIHLFVYMTLLGSAVAFARGGHLGMTTVARLLPARLRRAGTVLSGILACFLFLVVDGTLLKTIYAEITLFHATSPALGIPIWLYDAWVVVLSPFVFHGIYRGVRRGLCECPPGE